MLSHFIACGYFPQYITANNRSRDHLLKEHFLNGVVGDGRRRHHIRNTHTTAHTHHRRRRTAFVSDCGCGGSGVGALR